MGKYDYAIAKYKEAIEIKPDFYDTYEKLGYIYALKEDYLEAIQWVDHDIAIAPSPRKEAIGYIWKGLYHYWLGKLDTSFNDLGTLSDLAKESGTEYLIHNIDYLKGWIHFDRGELKQGEMCLKRWIDYAKATSLRSIQFAEVRWHLYEGFVHLKLGQLDSVNVKLTKVKSFLPKIDPAIINDELLYQYKLLHSEVLLAQDSLDKVIKICKNISTGK